MLFFIIQIFFKIGNCIEKHPFLEDFSAKKVLSECPSRPSGGSVKILVDNDYSYFSSSLVYGCRNHFQRKLQLNNCILQIYNSIFDLVKGDSSIYFSYTISTVPFIIDKQVDIIGCTFDTCNSNNGAAIFLNCSEVMKSINIVECQFRNLSSTDQGGSIYYYAFKDFKNPPYSTIEQTILYIHSCTFESTTCQTSGGAICISATNTDSTRPIEIRNCTFDHCEAYNSTTCNGGAIYITGSEGYRRFNIVNCSFISCSANSFGGAIYFNAAFGNIRDSIFTNNQASEGGNDIYYIGLNEQTNEKLSIFKCAFQQDESFSTIGKSLIYLTFSDFANFNFDNNQISFSDTDNSVRVFGYEETAKYAGSWTILDNSLSPPDNILFEQGNILSQKIDFYSAFWKTSAFQKCPTQPADSIVITPLSDHSQAGKLYYSCNQEFGEEKIIITNSVLDIYNCTFSKTRNENNAIAISISINSDLPTDSNSLTKIRNCVFSGCGSEAIHINSSSTSMGFDIISCSFLENKNGAIYIKTVLGLIKKCYFLDNSVDEKHLDITYSCSLDEKSDSQGEKFTISDNTFNLTYVDGIGQESGSFIYINFNSKSIVDFTDNKILIDGDLDSVTNLFVFDCPEASEKKGTWTILNNCLSPPNDKFINSRNIPINFIEDLDSAFQDTCLTKNCPSMLPNSQVLWDGNYKETDTFENQNLYACGQYLDTVINGHNCILQIYHCIFTASRPEELTKLGGAIYLSIGSLLESDLSGPIEIHNNQFYLCENDAGGAIYAESTDPQRLFDISDCFFQQNKAFSPEPSLGAGGAICISVVLAQIERCTFNSNNAKNGAAISVLRYSTYSDMQKVDVKSCLFNNNLADSNGGGIYYEYQSKPSSAFNSISLFESTSEYSLLITNSTFNGNQAVGSGGSMSLYITESDSNLFLITNCSLFECSAQKYGGAIHFESERQNQLNITDCIFRGNNATYGSAISFYAYSGQIERCQFFNQKESLNGHIINYKCNYNFYSLKLYFIVDSCTFLQTDEIASIFDALSKDVSYINFTNNNIVISNSKTTVFTSSYSIMGKWDFEGNSIVPPYDEFICGKGAQVLKASCSYGFTCILPTMVPTSTGTFGFCQPNTRCIFEGNENDPDFIIVSNSVFSQLKTDDGDGGAIYLKNCGIQCDTSKFSECSALNGGGGAIYISINKVINGPITIHASSFTTCRSSYGAALYVYCNDESNPAKFNTCTFLTNKAIKIEGRKLFGGSAIFLNVLSGSVDNCNFLRNSGGNSIKLYNNFEQGLLESDYQSLLSIFECRLEIDHNSKSSLYYVKEANKIVLINVKNCIFAGNLSNDAHHIEAYDNSKSNRFSDLMLIQNCKFSSDIKSALKINYDFAGFNVNEQEFNYVEKKQMLDGRPVLRDMSAFCLIVAAIFVFTVLFMFCILKSKTEKEKIDDISI